MSNYVLYAFSIPHLDLLSQEEWTKKEWLFWTGHRFSFPMVKAEFMAHIKEESRSWWILKRGDDIVGLGELQRIEHEEVKLSRIYIFKAYRGKGYSKKLMQLLMEKGKAMCASPVFCLNVFEENQIAINLYKSLGFKEVKEKRTELIIEDESLVLMNMELR